MNNIKKTNTWTGTTKGGSFGQKFLFFIFKIIPVCLLYPILFFVIPIYIITDKQKFLPIFNYFRNQFQNSKWKAFWNSYWNYIVFGQIVLDKFAILVGKTKQFKFEIIGHDFLDEVYNAQKGCLIASAHIGNFEMAGVALKDKQLKINSIIFSGETENMKQQRNSVYSNSNINTIVFSSDMSHLFKIKEVLEKKEFLTILCDRNFGSPKKQQVKFLSEETFFPQGPFRIAVQMDVPVITLFIMKKNIRKYVVYTQNISENIPNDINSIIKSKILTENFADCLEKILKKYPHQWFNYYEFWEKIK